MDQLRLNSQQNRVACSLLQQRLDANNAQYAESNKTWQRHLDAAKVARGEKDTLLDASSEKQQEQAETQ